MESTLDNLHSHRETPPHHGLGTWLQRGFFYAYLLVVLAAFVYPMHFLDAGGASVEVGRYILFLAPGVYQPDSLRIIREVMVATLIFLPFIHLTIRYGPSQT